MDYFGTFLVMAMAVITVDAGENLHVDGSAHCTTTLTDIAPASFTPYKLEEWEVVDVADINATDIHDSNSYLCGTDFLNMTWQVKYIEEEGKDSTVQNVSRIMAILPVQPRFGQPLLSDIYRTILESTDPLPGETPTPEAGCESNLVVPVMQDALPVKSDCREWLIARTWSLHVFNPSDDPSCQPPNWEIPKFIQTLHLVNEYPPDIFPVDSIPGAFSKPQLAKPKPMVSRCDHPVNPTPPQFFADPSCSTKTRVNLVGQTSVIPSSITNHVCGSQFIQNLWQAAYDEPCYGSSDPTPQLVTLLPAPPVFTHIPEAVSITTEESLDPDHLGHAAGSSPCGHAVDVTFVDKPPMPMGCGKWVITRMWTVSLLFSEEGCILPEQYTATASQLITITDVSAPEWVHPPPVELHIPFFENYQAEKPIPVARETAHPDMLKLGLVSYPIKLLSQDGVLHISRITSHDECAQGLAVMARTWTVSDTCGNNHSMVQIINFEHPPMGPTGTQHWDFTVLKYYLAPGVHQLTDACAAGKRVTGQTKEFLLTDPNGNPKDGCEGGLWSPVPCQEAGEASQAYYVQDIHSVPPYFPDDLFPPNVVIDTTQSLHPSVNTALGVPEGRDYCGTPLTVSYHDAPPVQQSCGVWTIERTWKVQPYYVDCGGAEATYPDALTVRRVQLITIHDTTAPQWVYLPQPEVYVPFFENYQAVNPIPQVNETAHDDMLPLGLVSYPVEVSSSDGEVVFTPVGEGECNKGLASFLRTWTAADACGNPRTYQQHIIVQHPPVGPTPTQPWRPADADLAPADRDITAPNRLFSYAPGVEQLADACYPGKKVMRSRAVFSGLWDVDHNCSAGQWSETGCRLEEQGGGGVSVHAWPPFFAKFPDNVTIFTNQSLNLEGPVGGSHCGTPFTITHWDSAPVKQGCGVWTIERSWKIQPNYSDCGGAEAKYADALTTIKVQVITVLDIFPPQFISKPQQDIFVEFLEDYGTSVTGIPQVEDIATDPDMAALHLISYPITLEYEDTHVDFITGAASHAQGMAVLSRLWTTKDACANTATWMQTIRVRNPNVNGNAGPLGAIGNFTVFATEEVHARSTAISGSVGSNSKIFLTTTQPSATVPFIVPNQEFTIFHFSEQLLSHSDRLFVDKLSACTGLKALKCVEPAQHTCQATLFSSPTNTTVYYDHSDNMILEGGDLLYNIFNGVEIDRWRYTPPTVALPNPPKQIIKAEGFIIINIMYSDLDASKTMLRESVFVQRFLAGAPFVLYNLKNIPEQPIQNMALRNTKLAGSLISQDSWNAMVLDTTVITGQVFAINKEVTAINCSFQGQLFVPNYQVVAPRPQAQVQLLNTPGPQNNARPLAIVSNQGDQPFAEPSLFPIRGWTMFAAGLFIITVASIVTMRWR